MVIRTRDSWNAWEIEMWSAFRSLAARIGLSTEQVVEVESKAEAHLVEDPLNPLVRYWVRPDPNWTERLGEAWNGTLVNSRRESAGTIPLANGLLTVATGHLPHEGITTRVVPGDYEVVLIIAHMGEQTNDDYEEHISHAFALLNDKRDVASIKPLTDEQGVELGVAAYLTAFAGAGVLQQVAGDHAGRWSLRIMGLFHPKDPEGNVSHRKAVRIVSDNGSGAAIFFHAGTNRGDYPLFSINDAQGNTVGVMADFFVDNRPW